MNLGIVSIQRDRATWLTEWFAFHYLIGFRKFYFYAHHCKDNTAEILLKLSKKLDITSFIIPDIMNRVQLKAYQHACDNFINDVDWMAFIDGDEFLFPTNTTTIQNVLSEYQTREDISALAVYSMTFGSSGHMKEPLGLITENYRYCNPNPSYRENRMVKSIVKGHQKVHVSECSHVFVTPKATIDELERPITWGFMENNTPSYKKLQLNHYVCQSYEFFKNFKSTSGHADCGSLAIRDEDWWVARDRNDVFDSSLVNFYEKLHETIEWLNS